MSFSSLSFQNCDRDLTPIVESSKEKEEAKSDHEQSDEELGSAMLSPHLSFLERTREPKERKERKKIKRAFPLFSLPC